MVERRVEPVNNFETNNRGGRKAASTARRAIPRAEPAGRYGKGSVEGASSLGERGSLSLVREHRGGKRQVVGAFQQSDEAVAAIVDPYGDGRKTMLATVNRRVDVLETELSHGRISEAAYLTGRYLQEIFERTSLIGGSSAGDGGSRRDPREVRIYQIARKICGAREILDLRDRLRGRIGDRAVRLLRRILSDGQTFATAAALEGKGGPRGTTFIAESFRVALEDAVGAVQEARGASRPTPQDEYATAGAEAALRSDASLEGGVTLARLENEIGTVKRSGCFSDGTRAKPGELSEMESRTAALRLKQAVAAAQVKA